MICKDCIKHDKCLKQNKLMLTVDDICELIYQHGVEKYCPHFIKADKVCKDCINYDECLAVKGNAKECLLFKNKADFVQVVRCKDCKCCEHCYPAKAIGEEAIEGWYCKIRNKYMRPDDFCSYGERKGGEDA